MRVLDLALKDGLRPEQLPNSNQEKYLSACPGCCGRDCFVIWASYSRYYCMRCQRRGVQVQYLRDFHALSYHEACNELGEATNTCPHTSLWVPPEPLEKMPSANKPLVVLDEQALIGIIEQHAGDLCHPITSQNFASSTFIDQTALILFASKDYVACSDRHPLIVLWPLPPSLTGIALHKWVLAGFRTFRYPCLATSKKSCNAGLF